MNVYKVRPMDLHAQSERCGEACIAVVIATEHHVEVQHLKDLGQRIDDQLIEAQRKLQACELQRDEWKKYADAGLSSYAELQAEVASYSSRLDREVKRADGEYERAEAYKFRVHELDAELRGARFTIAALCKENPDGTLYIRRGTLERLSPDASIECTTAIDGSREYRVVERQSPKDCEVCGMPHGMEHLRTVMAHRGCIIIGCTEPRVSDCYCATHEQTRQE